MEGQFNGILVDGRLAANTLWIYASRFPEECRWYKNTLYSDGEATSVANCAVQMTGYSAHVTAGLMVVQGIRYAQEDIPAYGFGMDLNHMIYLDYKEVKQEGGTVDVST